MKIWFLIFIICLSLISVIFRLHLVEKDFLEIIGAADGFYLEQKYCFMEIKNYAGLAFLTGIQGRPPLVPLLLATVFSVFGHNLRSISIAYALPRLVILPLLFFIALNFFKPRFAYCVASLALFFPFFDTYALATLKADVFVVAWSLAAVYFYLLWKRTSRPRDLLISSLFLSLNVLSKETALYFSAILWILQIMRIKQMPNKKTMLAALLGPVIFFILPFNAFSLFSTGRIFPSIFATAFDPGSFFTNIKTYVASMFYYSGIIFDQGKLLVISSLLKIGLILTGIFYVFKTRKYELIFPVMALLISISFINTRVIQGDSINREIIHRIAPIVPFTAVFMGFGIYNLTQLFIIHKNLLSSFSLFFVIAIELMFIKQYFTAPYALDYTDAEFYVSAFSIWNHSPPIPLSTFETKNNLCVMKTITAGDFLRNEYKSLKTSPFPQGLKELMIGIWIFPLITCFFWQKRLMRYVFK